MGFIAGVISTIFFLVCFATGLSQSVQTQENFKKAIRNEVELRLCSDLKVFEANLLDIETLLIREQAGDTEAVKDVVNLFKANVQEKLNRLPIAWTSCKKNSFPIESKIIKTKGRHSSMLPNWHYRIIKPGN